MKIETALLILLSASGAVGSATNADTEVGRAEALLKRSDETLFSAQTVKAVYTDTAVYSKPYRDLRQTGTVTLSKPGLTRVEIVRARRVNASDQWKDTGNNTLRLVDGARQYNVFFHPFSTQVRQSKSPATPTVNESPILAGFFSNGLSPWQRFEAAKEKGELKDVQVLGSEVRFMTGSTEQVVEIGANGLVESLKEQNVGSPDVRTWHLESIEIGESLPNSAFSYTPPADALPYERQETLDPIESGTKAPDIATQTLDGNPLKLSDYIGKVVVLKFWATWCWPCNQSMPETDALQAKYGPQGLTTVAVAIKDSRKGLIEWVAKHKQYSHIQFAFDDPARSDASKAFQVSATPTVYVIGKDGQVVAEFEGYTGPNPSLEKAITAALAR